MTRLSEHFELEELLRSGIAARLGIDMTPPPLVLRNLGRLATDVLEPLRAALCEALGRDVSIFVLSGYRPPYVNAIAGGSKASDHMTGSAADIVAPSVPFASFAALIKRHCEALPVKQCIHEFGQWVHVSIEDLGELPRQEYLVAQRINAKTEYMPWV